MTRIAFLLWPDTFEDWYDPLGVTRAEYLETYDREWSISLARSLAQNGVEVHLVHSTTGATARATQQPSGAVAHFVRATALYRLLRHATWGHRLWARTQRLWALAPVVSTLNPRLLQRLVTLRPDAVVIQDYETPRFDLAAPLLRAAGMRVIALDTGASARPSTAPWKRTTRDLAHQLLAVHDAEAERLRAAGHERVAVWPVPVRTDVYLPAGRAMARRDLGVNADERLVFAAARLHPVKNLPLLAEACRLAGARLVLTGEGSERWKLERHEHVTLLGWQPLEQLVKWYAAADVVGLSSNQEGQPIAVLEAFACSRAVVATDVGGVAEVVRPGRTGWLVEARDAKALADALVEALADRGRADAFGANGRALVLERHAADAVAAAFSRWASG